MQRHMPLGYKMTDGKIIVDEEKAEIVKRIFKSFISGKSLIKISQELTENGIPNANGKLSWNHSSVGNILKNIKYIGDGYHPAIINEIDYNTSQKMREDKAKQLNHSNNYLANSKTSTYPFSGKLICGDCGAIFKRYTEHHNKNKKCNWKCKKYIVNNRVCCKSAVIDDTQLEKAFVEVVNKVLNEPKLVCTRSKNFYLTDNSTGKDDTTTQKSKNAIKHIKQSNKLFTDPKETAKLLFRKVEEEYINCCVDDFTYQTNKLKKILNEIASVSTFDRGLFFGLINSITIYKDGSLKFEFINGATVEDSYELKRRTYGNKQ